jgi:hypothetical protein
VTIEGEDDNNSSLLGIGCVVVTLESKGKGHTSKDKVEK